MFAHKGNFNTFKKEEIIDFIFLTTMQVEMNNIEIKPHQAKTTQQQTCWIWENFLKNNSSVKEEIKTTNWNHLENNNRNIIVLETIGCLPNVHHCLALFTNRTLILLRVSLTLSPIPTFERVEIVVGWWDVCVSHE